MFQKPRRWALPWDMLTRDELRDEQLEGTFRGRESSKHLQCVQRGQEEARALFRRKTLKVPGKW